MADRKWGPVLLLLFPLFIGLMALNKVMHSPYYPLYRSVDIVQLTGSGVCFGVTMTLLIFILKRPRT